MTKAFGLSRLEKQILVDGVVFCEVSIWTLPFLARMLRGSGRSRRCQECDLAILVRRNDGIKVISNENHVQMIKASLFKESLSPLESLLDLTLAQLFIVDGDKLVHELQRVEHFVDTVWIDDS